MVRAGEELDLVRLQPFLRERFGDNGSVSVEQYPSGHSNLTYLVRVGKREVVLRRPPFGSKVRSAHDMAREYRVLSKLHTPTPLRRRPCSIATICRVSDAHVFGVSMGGMIAQEFALQYPARTRSLILGCTSPGGPSAVRAESKVADILMARGMTLEQAREAILPYIYDPATPREKIEEDVRLRRRWLPTLEGYMAQLQGILAWEGYSRIAQITAPTLVIHGKSDALVPPGNGELIAARIPGARLILLEHASHLFLTDQTQAAHKEILEFLLSHAGGEPKMETGRP